MRIDSGSATSPLLGGYSRLSPATAYSATTGYGWTGTTTGLSDRDRLAPDALRRDHVTSQSPATLRLNLPAGTRTIWILRGDNNFAAQPLLVDIGTTRVLNGGVTLGTAQYAWERITVTGGSTVDLRFSTNVTNEWWRFNALVIQ